MNQTNKRKMEKELVESYLNETNEDKKMEAYRRLTTFEKLEGELDLKKKERDQKDRELDIREDENEVRKELDKKKQELEEAKFAQNEEQENKKNELEVRKQELEEQKLAQEKELEELRQRSEKRTRLCTIICTALSAIGGIGGTIVGFKFYDKQINKAYQFEETGTVTSFAGKKTLGDALKLPKTK